MAAASARGGGKKPVGRGWGWAVVLGGEVAAAASRLALGKGVSAAVVSAAASGVSGVDDISDASAASSAGGGAGEGTDAIAGMKVGGGRRLAGAWTWPSAIWERSCCAETGERTRERRRRESVTRLLWVIFSLVELVVC